MVAVDVLLPNMETQEASTPPPDAPLDSTVDANLPSEPPAETPIEPRPDPELDFSTDWYDDRPKSAQQDAGESEETFDAIFAKLQSREDWKERHEEHIQERVRTANEPLLNEAQRQFAVIEEQNKARVAALTAADQGYKTVFGRLKKALDNGEVDEDTLTGVFQSVPDLAANLKLLSDETINKQVEEKIKAEIANANASASWGTVLWVMESGLKSVGLTRLWNKQRAKFDTIRDWNGVPATVGEIFKSALDAAYKRGVADAGRGLSEVKKVESRSNQGPDIHSAKTSRAKTDEEILAAGSGATTKEKEAAFTRLYGFEPRK